MLKVLENKNYTADHIHQGAFSTSTECKIFLKFRHSIQISSLKLTGLCADDSSDFNLC
jgi:hypothetical protein